MILLYSIFLLYRKDTNFLKFSFFSDTIVFHATITTMLERSEEPTAQQITVTIEKRTAESHICLTSALSIERQSHSVLAYEYKST